MTRRLPTTTGGALRPDSLGATSDQHWAGCGHTHAQGALSKPRSGKVFQLPGPRLLLDSPGAWDIAYDTSRPLSADATPAMHDCLGALLLGLGAFLTANLQAALRECCERAFKNTVDDLDSASSQ